MATKVKQHQSAGKRTTRVAFLLNDKEMRVLDVYCKRNRIRNRSQFIRRTLIKAILKRNELDSPTLFD